MFTLEGDGQVRAILDALPRAALLVECGKIRLLNDRAQQLFGYSQSELFGRRFELLVDPRDHPTLQKVLGSGDGTVEFLGVRKDGTVLELQMYAKPVSTIAGEARLVMLSPGLAVAQAFTKLLEAVPDAMVVVRDDGTIVLVNDRVKDLFGYCSEELLGHPVEVLMPERLASKHVSLRESYFRDPEVRLMNVRGRDLFGRRKDGSEFPVDIMLSPMKMEMGTVAVATIRDATHRVKLEGARLQLAVSGEAIRLRDEFVALVGHELRTPLTALHMHLDRLARDASRSELHVDSELAKHLSRMGSALGRTERLVDQLLEIPGFVTGALALDRREVDLGALVSDASEGFREELEAIGSRLTMTIPRPVVGNWDAGRLRQVVDQMLSNASKFGRGNPIEVQVDRNGNDALLAVRDHGIGVAAENPERLFERFARFEPSRHYGGLGLGLWMVQQIVAAHGGGVQVIPEADGATFKITLPLGER